MTRRVSIITLASSDLHRSLRFYRDGLGFASDGIAKPEHGGNHVAFDLGGGLTLVLFNRQALAALAPGGAPEAGGAILSLQVDTRGEVDTVLAAAKQAGGLIAVDALSESFGYHAHFRDPDGHLWEVVWFGGEPNGQ